MSHRRKPIPQEPIEVEVTGLSHDGRGIARQDNKVVFVFGALPGEKVLSKMTRCYTRYNEATTLEVLQPVASRVAPKCAHFGVCGGCQMQHLDSKHQVQHKQKMLEELLVHQAKVTPLEWLSPLVSEAFGYRQKARLGVRFVEKKETLLIGFREQGNNKIAIIEGCEVLDPRVGSKIKVLRDLINGLDVKNDIPQIEVAIGKDEVGLVFRHLNPLSEQDVAALTTFCQMHQFSLYLQPGGVDSVHKIWPPNSSLLLSYELSAQQLTYHFHPLDFTQVNQEINQQMVNQAIALLNPSSSDVILDLFCGLGNFSLPFAQKAAEVVGVEGTTQMVDRATENARYNQLTNVEFYTCDLSKDFADKAWAKKQYTKIILDPPRSGAEEVVNQISRFNAKEILYISCNPATFARDAAILVHHHGYRLVKVGVMDMFPHTAHVETIGLFRAP